MKMGKAARNIVRNVSAALPKEYLGDGNIASRKV